MPSVRRAADAQVSATTSRTSEIPQTAPANTIFSGWVLLPMRLFLGVTFIYAGIQKLTDPQFFHKSTPGYIGNQIIGFAHGSPLHNILTSLVLPHALQFGYLIALGEIAIGLGTLFGLLFRPAALCGLLLSLLFFLSASWHVYPYFYGADIVFVFCWLIMLLNGPTATGFLTLDTLIADKLFPAQTTGLTAIARALLVGKPDTQQFLPAQPTTSLNHQRGASLLQRKKESRRMFLSGTMLGVAGTLTVGAIALLFNSFSQQSSEQTNLPTTGTSTSGATATTTPAATSTTPATGATQGGSALAYTSKIAKNSATTFTIPSSGDPGVIIHLQNDQFVAYDATCTHAGCPVDYDPTSQHLICPCHGATFDPAQSAAVLVGPAGTPLTKVAIHIDSATGAITLQ